MFINKPLSKPLQKTVSDTEKNFKPMILPSINLFREVLRKVTFGFQSFTSLRSNLRLLRKTFFLKELYYSSKVPAKFKTFVHLLTEICLQ